MYGSSRPEQKGRMLPRVQDSPAAPETRTAATGASLREPTERMGVRKAMAKRRSGTQGPVNGNRTRMTSSER